MKKLIYLMLILLGLFSTEIIADTNSDGKEAMKDMATGLGRAAVGDAIGGVTGAAIKGSPAGTIVGGALSSTPTATDQQEYRERAEELERQKQEIDQSMRANSSSLPEYKNSPIPASTE
ncbi:MAG: hypothetical protein ACXV7J_00150 [Methylomonas sp.]